MRRIMALKLHKLQKYAVEMTKNISSSQKIIIQMQLFQSSPLKDPKIKRTNKRNFERKILQPKKISSYVPNNLIYRNLTDNKRP